LEAAQTRNLVGRLIRDGFEQLGTAHGAKAADYATSNGWVWQDPFEDCAFHVRDGLEIRAANGRGLGQINFSAPRLLRPAPEGDFAVQTLCRPALADRPAIGGLLLWLDERNYLRIERGTQGEREISLQGRVDGDDLVLGRGRLSVWESRDTPAPAHTGAGVWLRMEWVGGRISALCSADGDQWFSVGSATFPTGGHFRVGLHAVGDIDRNVYRGAYCDGTAIRFESFTLRSADR